MCNPKWCRQIYTNDVNKYAITNDVITYAITNDVIKYAIKNDVIKFSIKNYVIKFAITNDAIEKKSTLFSVSKHGFATHARCFVLVNVSFAKGVLQNIAHLHYCDFLEYWCKRLMFCFTWNPTRLTYLV